MTAGRGKKVEGRRNWLCRDEWWLTSGPPDVLGLQPPPIPGRVGWEGHVWQLTSSLPLVRRLVVSNHPSSCIHPRLLFTVNLLPMFLK